MRKVSIAVNAEYIDDFMEVLTDMGYRIGTITNSSWCIWVEVMAKKGGLSEDDLYIINIVKHELRDMV